MLLTRPILNALLDTAHSQTVVFHAKRDRATKANAHLAHLQAQTH